jgi:hypothetical protein
MEIKTCFVCGVEKPLLEYYKHPRMKDGHLNKCKDCTKKNVRDREEFLSNDSEWVNSERKRHREKYYRLGYKEKHKPTTEAKKKIMDLYKKQYPEKQKAKNSAQGIPRTDGYHLHHWSYNEEHYRDVIELSIKDHFFLHRHIIYDQERMMYRRKDTMELLATKEEHIRYFEHLKQNNEEESFQQ